MKDCFSNYDSWKLDNGEDGKNYQCETCNGNFNYDEVDEVEIQIDVFVQLCDSCREKIKEVENE